MPGTVPGADAGAYKSVLLECPSKERCSNPRSYGLSPSLLASIYGACNSPPKVITLAPRRALLRYSRFLDASNAVFLRWDFDFEAEIITFELQVRTAGWVGLGVTNHYSRAGGDPAVGGGLA